MKLFQYAVIWNATKEQEKDGKKSKVIVEVTTVLAPSQESATMLAARSIPQEYADQLEQCEIAIRPF